MGTIPLKTLYIFILFFTVLNSAAQSFAVKAGKLTGTFGVYHYKPFELNEKTSGEVVELFTESLDNRGIFLTAKHLEQLMQGGNALFSEIEAGSDSYFNKAVHVCKSALISSDSLLALLETKTLNYNTNDTITFLSVLSPTFFSPDLKFHERRLERYVKSRAYDRTSASDDFESMSEKDINLKSIDYSKAIVADLRKFYKKQIEQISVYVETNLLNAIALRYDPHSAYFNEDQNREFNRSLSAEIESFGLLLAENSDNSIVISHIEPGGSAWQSNDINEGDLLVSVKIGAQLLNSAGYSSADIQEKLDNSNEKKATFTLKKVNGSQKKVELMKRKTASSENSVQGFIIEAKGQKAGYISLPSFYTDMDNSSKPGCANDVAKEILKLQADTIDGLIIDLRNNGGGSMLEAMNLAGIFVDEGPLFIIKDRNRKPYLIKDINRGSIFKKPIVVLINETSASASELFSNIVKDYNLGVVVGQTSYGKGTAQSVIPLDTNLLRSKNPRSQNKDFIKITGSKFFRLNCSTHQGAGVVPDIILPSVSAYSAIYKESKEHFYLESDSIVKKVIYSPNKPFNTATLAANSSARIANSPAFKRYKASADSLSRSLTEKRKVALKAADYKKYKAEVNSIYNSFEQAGKNGQTEINCRNNSFDKKLNEVNDTVKDFNERLRKAIKEDIFVSEAFYILNDLIKQ